MTEKLRAAVIGVGHLGKEHARIYAECEGVDLVAVVDMNLESARQVGELYGAKPFEDVSRLDERLDVASVVVPTDAHFEVSGFLLKKGVHLLIEKPMTETVDEANELLRIGRENGAMIQVGHIERFNPAFLALREILTEPRFIEVHRLARYKPRGTEVGVVLDLMIHDIDVILSLVRSPVRDVRGVGVAILSRHEDIANARIEFENGCIANLTASKVSDKKMRKIRIFQRDAYISLDYGKQQGLMYRKVSGRIIREKVPVEQAEALKLEIDSFIQCVRSEAHPVVPGEHGRNALSIAMEIAAQIRNQPEYRNRSITNDPGP